MFKHATKSSLPQTDGVSESALPESSDNRRGDTGDVKLAREEWRRRRITHDRNDGIRAGEGGGIEQGEAPVERAPEERALSPAPSTTIRKSLFLVGGHPKFAPTPPTEPPRALTPQASEPNLLSEADMEPSRPSAIAHQTPTKALGFIDISGLFALRSEHPSEHPGSPPVRQLPRHAAVNGPNPPHGAVRNEATLRSPQDDATEQVKQQKDCTSPFTSKIPEKLKVRRSKPKPRPAIHFTRDQERVIGLAVTGKKNTFFTGRAGRLPSKSTCLGAMKLTLCTVYRYWEITRAQRAHTEAQE